MQATLLWVYAGLGAAGDALRGAAAAVLGALAAVAAKLKDLKLFEQDAQSLAAHGVLEAGGQIAALAGWMPAPIQQGSVTLCTVRLLY